MIYELYIIRKLSNKTMGEIFDIASELRQKKTKKRERMFYMMRRNLYIICENTYLSQKYNLACFNRSLALLYLASECGIDVTFCMGLTYGSALERKNLMGHAWIERNGQPIDNGNGNGYPKSFTYENRNDK